MNQRANPLTVKQPPQVTRLENVEHHDVQPLVHTQRDGGGVHHFQPLLYHVHVGQGVVAHGLRILAWVGVVYAVHAVFRHQHHLGPDLQRPQRGCGVGGKEWRAVATAKNHHAALFQVTHGPPPDVRLGHLRHLNGGHDACGLSGLLHRVLQGHGVHDGAQHADVVGGGRVHTRTVACPAPEVTAADHDAQLDARAAQCLDNAA